MGKKKSYVPSRRMTKTELLLLQTLQKGRKANINAFISIRQSTDPLSIQERRYRRFLAKQKHFKERGIEGY